jgi:hypothetical protein
MIYKQWNYGSERSDANPKTKKGAVKNVYRIVQAEVFSLFWIQNRLWLESVVLLVPDRSGIAEGCPMIFQDSPL